MHKFTKKLFAFVFAFLFCVLTIPMSCVFAKSSGYTVKFRAGNVNTFNTDVLSEYHITGEKNYFSVFVNDGQTVREALAETIAAQKEISDAQLEMFFERVLNESTEYNLMNVSSWCEDIDSTIKHNEEYVLDYYKIVDPVKYTVYFLDDEDKSQIAQPWIRYVSKDKLEDMVLTVEPAVIQNYATSNTAVRIDLSEAKDHEVSFYYVYTGEYDHVLSGENGEIIYRDVVHEVVVNNPPVVDGNQQLNNNGGGNNPAGNDNGQNPNPNNDDNQVQPNNEDPVVIEDSQTPLAPSDTQIPDEEVPMNGGKKADSPLANVIFISSTIASLLIFATVMYLIVRNQKKHAKDLSDDDNE